MKRILVVFASHHGQTGRVAEHIAERLRARQVEVELCNLGEGGAADPEGFDAILVGAPVQFSRHDRRVGDWLARHRAALARHRGAFFSVSMSAASTRPEVRAKLESIVMGFLAENGFHPAHVVKLAGALRYTRYSFFVRHMIRLISGSQGRPPDSSRDHELTDWAQVDRFVDDVLLGLGLLPGRLAACA